VIENNYSPHHELEINTFAINCVVSRHQNSPKWCVIIIVW